MVSRWGEDSVEVIKKFSIFFSGKKGPKKITIFGHKAWQRRSTAEKRIKSSHSLNCTLLPPSHSLHPLILKSPSLKKKRKNNLSMKNKFNIKAPNFLYSHSQTLPSLSRSFFYSEKTPTNFFSSFFIFLLLFPFFFSLLYSHHHCAVH